MTPAQYKTEIHFRVVSWPCEIGCLGYLTETRSAAGMIIDAAGERSEQGRYLSKAPTAATRS
jgi:hypothetical protein